MRKVQSLLTRLFNNQFSSAVTAFFVLICFANARSALAELSRPESQLSQVQITSGFAHACTLAAHKVQCWGSNQYGQATVPSLDLPVQINAGGIHSCTVVNASPSLNAPIQVASGFFHTCALTADGVKCWGDNDFGQTDVPNLIRPTQIAAGGTHTCAITAEGVKCWGDNSKGQI